MSMLAASRAQPIASTSGRTSTSILKPRFGAIAFARVRELHVTPGCSGSRMLRSCRHARPSFRLKATQNEEDQKTNDIPESKEAKDSRINKTLADLDAILGVSEEEAKKKEEAEKKTDVSIAPSVFGKLAEADAQRPGATGPQDEVDMQLQRLIVKARNMAQKQEGGASTEAEQQLLKREFETLISSISSKSAGLMSKDEIQQLKDGVFGPQIFWVTETLPISTLETSGILIRGNLRDDRSRVFPFVTEKVKELFGDKYTVLLVEDPAAAELSQSAVSTAQSAAWNTPRVAFQIVPTAQATPPQAPLWVSIVSVFLLFLFVFCCGELAIAANVTKLPPETIAWLSKPENIETNALPPGLDTWDPVPYFQTALPIFFSLVGTNLAHEVGHRIMAPLRNAKLGPTVIIPNLQLGAFGAITPFTSLLKDRKALWDVSSAGPLTGLAVSAVLLLIGILQSQGVDPATNVDPTLVPVPTQLFQGSLLLGSVARLMLGEAALRGTQVLVSPLVIAGWCGVVSQALQLLPVGSVDGGRMVQASFGTQTLSLSSFFTYVGLALGLLGSSLALPYGIYVILCQRNAERYVQDTVTPAGDARSSVTLVAVLTAILVLLPMAPELAQSFGIGPSNPFL